MSCRQITSILAKASRVVNHVSKLTIATEKMETFYGKSLLSKNDTRWNSKLKKVPQNIEMDVAKVVEKHELHPTSYEKAILRELVKVLKRFEEATNITQVVTYISIILVNPSLCGLKKYQPNLITRHSTSLVATLGSSIDIAFGIF